MDMALKRLAAACLLCAAAACGSTPRVVMDDARTLRSGGAATTLEAGEPATCKTPAVWPSPTMHRGQGSFDDTMAEVADRVPEFAGLSVDEKRRAMLVRVTDGSAETARRAFETYLDVAGETSFDGYASEPVDVAYGWHQLKTWYDTASQAGVWSAGLTMSDIDEARNKLVYGSANPDHARPCIASIMRAYDVPDDAWLVERQEAERIGG